jgi:hypothetical protein
MRGKLDDMVEIVSAFQEGAHSFVVVAINVDGARQKFRFGITDAGYGALRKVLQSRPFDQMPGTQYRYYFTGTCGRIAGQKMSFIEIRIEETKNGREFEFSAPDDLVANLMWWNRLTNFSQAEHLKTQ